MKAPQDLFIAADDERIRAPFKESWLCDLIHVKGGINDYRVIDVHVLRQSQGNHRSQNKPFKPVSDGFEIYFRRKELLAGEKE